MDQSPTEDVTTPEGKPLYTLAQYQALKQQEELDAAKDASQGDVINDKLTTWTNVGDIIEHQGEKFRVRKKTFKGDLVLRRMR